MGRQFPGRWSSVPRASGQRVVARAAGKGARTGQSVGPGAAEQEDAGCEGADTGPVRPERVVPGSAGNRQAAGRNGDVEVPVARELHPARTGTVDARRPRDGDGAHHAVHVREPRGDCGLDLGDTAGFSGQARPERAFQVDVRVAVSEDGQRVDRGRGAAWHADVVRTVAPSDVPVREDAHVQSGSVPVDRARRAVDDARGLCGRRYGSGEGKQESGDERDREGPVHVGDAMRPNCGCRVAIPARGWVCYVRHRSPVPAGVRGRTGRPRSPRTRCSHPPPRSRTR